MWFLSVHVHRLIPCPMLSMGPGLAGLRCLGMSWPKKFGLLRNPKFLHVYAMMPFWNRKFFLFPRRLPSCGSSQGRFSMSRSSSNVLNTNVADQPILTHWHIMTYPLGQMSAQWMFILPLRLFQTSRLVDVSHVIQAPGQNWKAPPVLFVGFEQPHQHPSTSLIYLSKSLVSLLN